LDAVAVQAGWQDDPLLVGKTGASAVRGSSESEAGLGFGLRAPLLSDDEPHERL